MRALSLGVTASTVLIAAGAGLAGLSLLLLRMGHRVSTEGVMAVALLVLSVLLSTGIQILRELNVADRGRRSEWASPDTRGLVAATRIAAELLAAVSRERGRLAAGGVPDDETTRAVLEARWLGRAVVNSGLSVRSRLLAQPWLTTLLMESSALEQQGERVSSLLQKKPVPHERVGQVSTLREICKGRRFFPISVRKVAQDGPRARVHIPVGHTVQILEKDPRIHILFHGEVTGSDEDCRQWIALAEGE